MRLLPGCAKRGSVAALVVVLAVCASSAVSAILPWSSSDFKYDKGVCEHSCVKVMNDVCISEWGELLSDSQVRGMKEKSSLPAFEDKYIPVVPGYDVWSSGNPQHQVHEIWFPILFYAENCARNNPASIIALPSMCSSYAQLFNPMVRSALPADRIIGGHCSEQEMNSASSLFTSDQFLEVQVDRNGGGTPRCFKTAHVLLNMFRGDPKGHTTCMHDSAYRSRASSLWRNLKFNYAHAGTLNVMRVQDDQSVAPVEDEVRIKTMLRIRSFLADRMKWEYPSAPIDVSKLGKRGAAPLRVFLAVRKNIGRNQVNEKELVDHLNKAFASWKRPNTEIKVGLFGGGMEKWTPVEQMREFYNADVVISVHGAQLSNSISMRPGSLIISQCVGDKTCVRWEHASAELLGVKAIGIQAEAWNSTGQTNFMIHKITQTLGREIHAEG